MPTFPTPHPIELRVEVPVGLVRITASDRDTTTVTVQPTRPSRSGDVAAAEQTRVHFTDGRVTVSSPAKWSVFRVAPSVDIDIELPAGSRVTGQAKYGGITATGSLGDCSLQTSAGAIQLDEAASATITVAHGDLTVGQIVGRADLTTSSGSVRVRRLGGESRIKTAHGGIDVRGAHGPVEISTSSGEINVDRAHASVTASTAYGKIQIGECARGEIRLNSSYGEMALGIRSGTAAWLDLASDHGTVRNEMTPEAGPGSSEETVAVHARTTYGDIVVRRAAAFLVHDESL